MNLSTDASVHHASGDGLTPALLGVLAGSALQLTQPQLWSASIYVCFVLLALLLIALIATKNNFLEAVSQACRALLLGALWALLAFGGVGLRASTFATHTLAPELEGRDLWVSGRVDSLPQAFALGVRFRFKPDSAQWQGQAVALPARLDLAWYGDARAFDADADDTTLSPPRPAQGAPRAGERWQFMVRLKAVHGSVNPHGFDHELWQWEQGVQASGYVRTGAHDPPPVRLAPSSLTTLDHWRERVRARVQVQVTDANAAGLIAGLVVGDQSAIDRADWDTFRATGVAHLVSISGLHISMFAWLAARLVGALWRRSHRLCLRLSASHAALMGGVLLALAYALFSGLGVPAQRTVLMLATVALLRLSGVQWPWPMVWLLTCAVVVLVDPWALLQPGFWLSFVAVGILFASDSGALSVDRESVRGRFVKFFREQWVITLALAPLSWLLFGQVSLVGLLANALAIPWVTLLITPTALLGVLVPVLWDVSAWAGGLMLDGLRALAAWPWAVLRMAQAPAWGALLGVLGGVMLALRLPPWLRLSGSGLLLPMLLWQAPVPAQTEFELLAADVGQGSAVLVRTAGHALLFDAGARYSADSDAGSRILVPLLFALGVRLDRLVLSHRDSDHVGGAGAVLAAQQQADVLSPFDPPTEVIGAHVRHDCVAGLRWQWDGVDFAVLHPLAPVEAGARNTNRTSCVLRVSNARHAVLLTGDIEQAQEAVLVQRQGEGPLHADVLVAPHHGSKTSSSAALLDAVRPRMVVVQSGYRNRFGHPHVPVLVRYAERNIQVIDTPHCGALTWQSWRASAPECQRQRDLRYWRHQPL